MLATSAKFTRTSHSAVLPFEVFAVILAVPWFTAVTFPLLSTVATFVFELDQVTVLSFALSGLTVAVSLPL